MGVGEDVGVGVYEDGGHAGAGAWGDDPIFALHWFVGSDALETSGDSVG